MKIVLIAAGKGGTGKSTTTAMIGMALSFDHKVALLDLDTQGPNLPRMLGLPQCQVRCDNDYFYPEQYSNNLEVFSPSFMIPPDVACAWTGERRKELIHELIDKVKWNNPEILLCDCPPGTSDEILAILQYAPKVDGAVIVCTGKRESVDDARRLIGLFNNRMYKIPVFGIIKNMGYLEADWGEIPLFNDGVDIGSELNTEVIDNIPWRSYVTPDMFSKSADVILKKLNVNGRNL